MGTYRISRNIEASIIDYIREEVFSASWNNINVEKTFAKVYEISLPTVCIRQGDTIHTKVELGTNSTYRTPSILIDIFATNDGNRLDLKDFIVDIIKRGCPYYEYTITSGQISAKTQTGRITIINITDTIINLDTDKSLLDVHDRYRHLISLEISLGKVEN